MKSSIMITGSRDVNRDTARSLFEEYLSPLLSQGRTWLVGTSRGIDEWAIEWLLENGESCWAVLPYTRFRQPQWVQTWLEQIDRIVELQLPKRKTASMIRNRHMVDLAGIVFGFWSGKGGTAVKTLKYALRQRREVHAVPVFSPQGSHSNGDESVFSAIKS
ncbi:MAG TPA: DNA-processing protein DprA [Pyrinomonadaceae bacterium]|nr:DNA-processing protein DprA [Pyrinomonadaceae bacterium]